MAEHVLVLGGGMDMPAMLREQGPDVRTTVACQLPVLPKIRRSAEHSRVLALRADAPAAEWAAVVKAVHALDPFTRVAAFAERDQDRAAALARELGLAMHSPHTVHLVHHKPSMRTRLAETGVDDTPFTVAADAAELHAFLARHGGPCIVKPAVGAGSTGVHRLDSAADVSAAFARADQDGEWARGGVLAERLHTGPQFSVEAFSEDGDHQVVCVTRKYSDPQTFVELGHVVPAPLAQADHEAITRHVTAVLDALDIRFGPTHTEVVLTDDGPRTIETHIRLGGDEIPALVHAALGIDLERHTVRQVLGLPVLAELRAELATAAATTPRYEAVWFARPTAPGTLNAIDGLDQARAGHGVSEVRPLAEPGTELAPLDSSAARLALARAHGPDAPTALTRARTATTTLRFHVTLNPDHDSPLI
ncbi:ATP-grasp domain-containing protein [Kitasatospora sp. NPDC059599]|uniref:ATP-grasp domain-containing protein n=1 Tax=Kitasatospora sp. NPDC059599 TaxID=3346880 RepID=UPI0036CA635D